jgi:hypothetical protein
LLQLGRSMLMEQIEGVKQIVTERTRRRKRQELELGSADSPLHIHDGGRSLAINIVTGEGILEVGELAAKEAVRLAVDPHRCVGVSEARVGNHMVSELSSSLLYLHTRFVGADWGGVGSLRTARRSSLRATPRWAKRRSALGTHSNSCGWVA